MAKSKKSTDYNDFLNRINTNANNWSNKYQTTNTINTTSSYNTSSVFSKSNTSYDVDFTTFYNRIQGKAKDWYNEYEIPRQREEYIKKIKEEAEKEETIRQTYYEANKETLKEENTNNLIYNWNINRDENGYVIYNYGNMPIRDKNGYMKKVDSDGNIYWLDLNTNNLYDNKYKLVSADENFINSLKYEYDEKAGNVVNGSLLNKADRVGLKTIDKSQYSFLIDNEKEDLDNKKEEWNNKNNTIKEYQEGIYSKSREGIKTTQYGEGLNTQVEENTKKELTNQNPYNNKKSIYEEQFDILNDAIKNGEYTKANNALQIINKKYFGYSYNDGVLDAFFGDNTDEFTFFENRFNNNVKQLEVINNSIKTVKDEETLAALYEEKNKLEFENLLIQYNKIYAINSDMQLIEKIDNIYNPVYDTYDKTVELWSKTFSEFDDGYNFGDVFKTYKKALNNELQSIGAMGKMINAGFQFAETMIVSDMDESKFKDIWAPAIMDVATYMIPYVGQARIYINYMEPASVIGAGILREGSTTIDTNDGSIRTPDLKNIIGAGLNIGMNYFSDFIFKAMSGRIRGKIGNKALLELERRWYSSTARRILTNMAIHGSEEAVEEFVQTYAEYMQNMEGDLTWDFFKEHTDEALKSAFIAFVTAGGASGISSTINNIKLGENASWYDSHGNYIGPGAEKIGEGQKYNTVEEYFKAVKNGNENILDTEYYTGAENIRINDDIVNDTVKTPYVSSDTKTYEDMDYKSEYSEDVIIEDDEDAITNIAERLENDEVITILDNDIVRTNRNTDLNLEIESDSNSNLTISDRDIYDNSKITIVPSKEMETYLKSLENYNGQPIYIADPKSDTFMDDVRNYVNDIGKSNIVVKNNQDFNPNQYVLTPQEMNDINKMVQDATNKANLFDSINTKGEIKLNPITVSDISDSDVNTIVNTIKNKFLDELSKNRYSKETAIREFKTLSGQLEGYLNNREEHRTYLSDNKNRIITFYKTGPNMYEAANTLPKTMGDMQVLANVKTNGNVLNGNLTAPLNLTKQQANNVNNLISKLGLKGNFLTEKSSGRDVAELVKLNRGESKEILQALGADGLIEGKNKVRLYTAYDNLDNANPAGAIKNTVTYLASEKAKNELVIRSNTTAPKNIDTKKEPSNLPELNEAISVKENAFDPENTTELNNIEAEEVFNKEFDKLWSQLKITNKTKVNKNEIKTWVKKMLFDRRVHINNIAIPNGDYNVRAALASLDAVASDAQVMKEGAQIRNNEIVGKSLNSIFKPLKGKAERNLFQKYIMLELNIERETARVDKVFENLSKEQSRKQADIILKQHPKFAEIAKDLQRYNNTLLDLLVDGGVISNDIATKLKNRYKYYMPIYSSELSTFNDLDNNKYIKALNINNTLKDVTKAGKQILSIQKSMENKTYNVLSAIAKNKLAQELAISTNYIGDGKADLIYYQDGKITKMKTSNDIIDDINGDDVSHIVDMISEVPIFKQLIDLNKLSYKFILDPVYQIKNVVIDFTDSQLVYSKDKKNFAKNYIRAIIAVANNSEVYNEFKEVGLGKIGEEWNAPTITYNEDGSVNVKQNKFQRVYANLEAMPKLAEYLSLKDKYLKQARQDYSDGLYTKDGNHLKFNEDEKYTLNHWSGTDSYIINEHFRDGTNITEDLQKISDNMDSILDKTQSESGTFNRSINLEGDKLNQFLDKYQKGKIVTENAFTSMSKDIIYDDTMNIQMEIKTKYAKDLSSELRTDEHERLLRRNSKFRVDDVEITNSIVMREVNNEKIYSNNPTVKLKLTDVSEDTSLYKDNLTIKDIENQIKIKAKVEAQDVNLNFDSGGVASKALSKSGFKFLNAGMLGFDKFITHVGEGVKTPKGMGRLLLEFTSIGATTAIANRILNGDDDEYDKLPYYYKNNYYMIKLGEDKWLRIPKGRVQTLYNVLFEYGTGIRTEDDAQTYIDSIKSAFELAVLPPALKESSPAAAIQQVFENKDAFGNPIYSEDYDSTGTKVQKVFYHLLSSYFGRYGRIVKDITDEDGTTDLWNEFDYYKDTTKANRHYQTVINLVNYYKKSDNVKTLDDKAMKKYIDTQNYALRTINSEISQGKKTGQTTDDLKMKYRARDDLLTSMIANYKNYDKVIDENGNTWYYFDDLIFMYNNKTGKFVKK